MNVGGIPLAVFPPQSMANTPLFNPAMLSSMLNGSQLAAQMMNVRGFPAGMPTLPPGYFSNSATQHMTGMPTLPTFPSPAPARLGVTASPTG